MNFGRIRMSIHMDMNKDVHLCDKLKNEMPYTYSMGCLLARMITLSPLIRATQRGKHKGKDKTKRVVIVLARLTVMILQRSVYTHASRLPLYCVFGVNRVRLKF